MKPILFLTLLSSFSASITSVLAGPVATSPEKRQVECPEVDQIADYLAGKWTTEQKQQIVFYTGGAGSDAVKLARVLGGKTYLDLQSDPKYSTWMRGCSLLGRSQDLAINASTALARIADETALVVVEDHPNPESYWFVYEKPELVNRNIHIVRVFPKEGQSPGDWRMEG
ncbi:hypothetical protein FQN52_007077 [Onygenales sp. PD_12]|nr:hypothetical protein FQN52_007077 [Onygenales sp. PD_12]